MDYWTGIIRAVIPRKLKDVVALAVLVPGFSVIGYKLIFPTVPNITVYEETQYPKEVRRGDYFFLNFDLSWDQTCLVTSKRYITGTNGIEYLAAEDTKQVIKDQRMRYIVRFPINLSVPYGQATVRSDFSYACDWFSRYIREAKVTGRNRYITVLPGMTVMPQGKSVLTD